MAALIAVLVGLGALLRQVYTSRFPGGNDLYPRWSAGCSWLTRGQDPYSREATREIQRGIYGRLASGEEDQAAFAYPVYTVLLTWPLCLTDDFATAHAAAMSALIAGIVVTAAAARRVVGLRLGSRPWVWVVLWVVLMYPSVRGIVLGQPAVVVSLLQVVALLALRRGHDVAAGVALALSTIKPQMALLFVPWVLIWCGFASRWRALGAFAVSLAGFVVVPLAWLPRWPMDWIGQLPTYAGYTEYGSLTWILTTRLLGTPPAVEIAITGALVAWAAFEAARHRRAGFDVALWATSLLLVLTHFITPRTATTHFGSLLVPFFLLARLWLEARGRVAEWGLLALMPLLGLLTWWLFLATVDGRQESALNYLPIPLALLGLLLVARRPWAAVGAGR